MLKAEDWLRPDWAGVRACQTGLGFNLGWRQGDVRANQAALAAHLGAPPVFLSQVHGTQVVRLQPSLLSEPRPEADAAVCTDPGLAVVILVADCLLVPQIFNARRFDAQLNHVPRVMLVFEACMRLDAFAKTQPSHCPDAEG